MKQYLMSVWHEEDYTEPPEQMEQIFKDVDAFNNELLAQDLMVFGGGLHPPSTATVVQAKDGEVLTTDGPFVETKEQIGGFWIVKAPDLDAALALAAKATKACRLPVEVRPFQEEPES